MVEWVVLAALPGLWHGGSLARSTHPKLTRTIEQQGV